MKRVDFRALTMKSDLNGHRNVIVSSLRELQVFRVSHGGGGFGIE
jgi:hypothetical protein